MNQISCFEKTTKIKEAFKNAILAKNNTTDIAFHIEKIFKNSSKKEIQNIIKNFNLISLKENNILNIEKSELDKRSKEYRFDTLHKLCKNYAEISKSLYNINLEEVIADEIAEIFLINSQYCNFDLLKEINYAVKEKLKHIFGKNIEIEKIKRREFTFTNAAYSTSSFYLDDFIFDAIINITNKKINKEKLNEEVRFFHYLIKNLII